MKIRDIIDNLDKSAKNSDHVCLVEMGEQFEIWGGIPYVTKEGNRIKCYWVANHYCTDTYVGIRAYFLDDTFVAMSYQSARKDSEEFDWVSTEHHLMVRSYLLSLLDDEYAPNIVVLDDEEDLGEGYPVNYVGQLLTKDVLYKGEMVKVTKEDSQGYKNFHSITIEYKDGMEEDIDIRDILVPWKIKEET